MEADWRGVTVHGPAWGCMGQAGNLTDAEVKKWLVKQQQIGREAG